MVVSVSWLGLIVVDLDVGWQARCFGWLVVFC